MTGCSLTGDSSPSFRPYGGSVKNTVPSPRATTSLGLLKRLPSIQVNHLETEQARAQARQRVLSWYLHSTDAAQRRISPFDRYQLDTPPPTDPVPLAIDGYEPALAWYRAEAANLVAAVEAAASVGEHGIAWRLAAVLRAIHMHHHSFDDWIATARIGARSAALLGDRAGEAEALESLGKALFQSRALTEAGVCHRRALSIRRELGDRFGEAVSLNALGLLALRLRHLDQAATLFRDGESTFAELGESRWTALLRANRAEALCERGELPAAAALLREALTVLRKLGDRYGEGNALHLLAWVHCAGGRLDEARAAIDEALQIATTDDNQMRQAH